LRQQDTFEMYPASSDSPNPVEGFFTAEVVEDICRANKICHMDDIFAMGLQGNLTILNKVSAATIPLGQFGRCIGFILIYRPCQTALADEELNRIYAVSPGLFCAIRACLVHSHT